MPPPHGGGWPPGPPPGGGPPGRRTGLFILLAVIVVLGAVVALVLVTNSDDDDKKGPAESTRNTTPEPTPSLSIPSQIPTDLPTGLPTELPTELPSGVPSLPTDFPTLPTDFPSGVDPALPSPAAGQVPYYLLKAGDCFNIDSSRPGQARKKSCTAPHDAEVVDLAELKGSLTTDAALKKAAADLCRRTLERKARSQPPGTVRGTLVQYPDASGYRVGIDDVACSLAGDSGAGKRKLTRPLS
ncbi:hypothetical protein [Streptomyces sp. NPDC002564]|uniref:hypothetical protein n=1 Tax=Streptomyces sp. NPDC002564 TaxID=3364649 RepID=UPI0036BD16BD